jgi:hypothetical protein
MCELGDRHNRSLPIVMALNVRGERAWRLGYKLMNITNYLSLIAGSGVCVCVLHLDCSFPTPQGLHLEQRRARNSMRSPPPGTTQMWGSGKANEHG